MARHNERRLKSASESPEAAALREAIGAGPDEEVWVQTPQFGREADATDPASPPTDWRALRHMSPVALNELGCQQWDEPDDRGEVLMLFPGEWYPTIPEGHPITDIFGVTEAFKRGHRNDDSRYGVLSFGVCVPVSRTDAEPKGDGDGSDR